jgi:drug/metabolite transporter (DMT)-like permease
MQQPSRLGYLLSIAAAMAWASTSPGIKYLLEVYHIPPLLIAFWRDVFIALACLAGLLVVRPRLLRVSRRALAGFALTGIVSIGIYHALWVLSIALNGAAVAIVLIYTFPTFVTIGAWALFGEPIRRPQSAALALALIGCALLVRVYDPATLRVSWIGALVGLATGLTHAIYVLFNQRAMESHTPWTSLTYTMLFGSIALLVIVLISGLEAAPTGLLYGVPGVRDTLEPWLAVLALALGPTLGGYALFTTALRYIPGRIASLIVVIEAPVATLLAVAILGERLAWPQVVGIALILSAIVLPTLLARSKQVSLPRTRFRVSEVASLPEE